MKRKWFGYRQYGIVLALLMVAAPALYAQDSLSIGVQSTLPKFQLTSNPTATSNLVLLTNWNFPQTLFAHLSVCVYMTSPMAGTGNNTDTIPASAVQVDGSSIVTGSTNCGIPSSTAVVTNSLIWFLGGSASSRIQNGSRSDTLGISISGYPNNLEPDTYTGSINLIVSVQ